MATVISVENLSKSYRLGTIGGGTLRADVSRWLAKLRGKTDPNLKIGQEHHARLEGQVFHALQDVCFEVKQGEILGIIGRNGAGKSTLLKILSRVTAPTSGEVKVKGRIASLLEVGTGFHPELTGRENIFLNGAILGMTKGEIKKKFDEIVAFSEVEDFIDTPVKRYSSGMYVRLAFAVAAHLEPEILIVDEVLAVGDQQFQEKCIGKMKDVSRGGRSVLFVSHNLASVRALCSKGLLLQNGIVEYTGPTDEVLERYVGLVSSQNIVTFEPNLEKPSITRIEIETAALSRGDIVLNVDFSSPFPLRPPVPGVVIYTGSRTPVFGSNPRFDGCDFLDSSMKTGRLRIAMEKPPLRPGRYMLAVWLGDWQNDYDHKQDIMTFEFGEENKKAHQPPLDVIGPLKTSARWAVIEA